MTTGALWAIPFSRRIAATAFAMVVASGVAVAEPPASDVLQTMIAHAESHPDGQAPYSFDRSAWSGDVSQLPIGVFDSGIGGLTVLESILALDAFDNDTLRPGADGRRDFEDERFVYLGDQANMPYGNYPAAGKADYLRELILKDASFLLGRRYFEASGATQPSFDKPPVKAIVIACNTATAYGLEDIRAALHAWQLPVIVVGVVEAGAQEVAQKITDTDAPGTVAVLATVGTCSSLAYPKAIGQAVGLAGKRMPQVVQQGSTGLAEAIEQSPAAAADSIRDDVTALVENYRIGGGQQPISSVVLGCTHFPLVQDQIAEELSRLRQLELAGERPYQPLIAAEVRWIDPAEVTAKALFRQLATARLRNTARRPAAVEDDLLFLSVPDPTWPGIPLDAAGGLEHQYKYGRQYGQLAVEATRYVPMTSDRLPAASLNLIRSRLPNVSERLK